MIVAVKREQFADQQQQSVADAVVRVADAFNSVPYNDGNLVKNTTFTAGGSVAVIHKLTRAPRGWFPVKVTGGYGVFQQTAANEFTVTIQSQNACTADFWVF